MLSNADHWLRMQAAYDLVQARKTESKIKIYRCYILLAVDCNS